MMSQTDNAFFADKIMLRDRMMRLAGLKELDVLDLFSGAGHIWSELGKKWTIHSYLPCDRKPRQAGTLRLEVTQHSVRAFRPDTFNVVDVDCYGDGFDLLPHFFSGTKPLVIFLTHGTVALGPTALSHHLRKALGIPLTWRIPTNNPLLHYCGEQFLRKHLPARTKRVEYITHPNVRYYAIELG